MAKSKTSAPAAPEEPKQPPSAESSSEDAAPSDEDSLFGLVWASVCGYAIYRIIYYSYRIRMAAIDEYGPVIHEFDPYFNYRATEVRKQKQIKDFGLKSNSCAYLTTLAISFCLSLLLPVPLRARCIKILSMVRLQSVVSIGTARWNYHLSRNAVHCRVHQAFSFG